MNMVQYKNNLYKNGEYRKDISKAMARDKAIINAPTAKQLSYRNDIWNFCHEKGIIKDGMFQRKTNRGITSDIRALITIMNKNGLADEFFARNRERKDNEKKAD